ncbi:MAG TPA: replication protein RepA [Thermococcus litoralis]|uniref:Replication protein RepA n=1 Tax=Thermococcus litoralis TaxID=2265 RepID=A0A7C0TZM7_THELI|nr:MAG: replication protein RepA [Thermococci archaeon]RLF87949.1 MAG: replication protein RepA [Thermococci archaeon]HDD31889.1 replication protein RepA [Thermococcus litoralis]
MEDVPQIRRRRPAVEKKIAEITPEDVRVSLVGKVVKVDKIDYIFWLDDGTGVIAIECEENILPKIGQMVRVIGRVIRNEKVHIYGEVVQDFSNVNLEYLEEIQKLEEKLLPKLENALVWWLE